jgi:alpha-galactosidase
MKKFIGLFLVLVCFEVNAQKFDLAKTPPMGWNSWNKFGCNVSEKLIKETADVMVSSGMKDAGFEYIVIDDCWQVSRDAQGNIVADPERFPSGMKALADYAHSKGLKFGLYSCAGKKTCAGRPGGSGHEYQDGKMYASWGIDYLKYDWCNTGTENAQASYSRIRDALYEAGHPIILSLCEWGQNKPWLWAKDVGHLWRTTSDILDCWDCEINWGGGGIAKIIDLQAELYKYAGPGHWNDPDMLEVGNGGLNDIENKSHFSMWCILAAPLMAGNDLRSMSDAVKAIFTNKEVIAVNQDPLGKQGFRFMKFDKIEVWIKPLQNNELAVCFLNKGNDTGSIDYNWSKFGINDFEDNWKSYPTENMKIRDLWAKKDIGTTKESLKVRLAPHEVLLVRLTK